MEGNEDVLQRIVDELVEGGYYRARISSLSPFDKLTGGLAWCITASNVDVDFDLFYDDDATLGYKIKVGEAIEAALQKMECPYPLQAHQIQGLDYPAVYPVVQWLVKRVITTRELLGDQLRRFSHWRFNKEYGFSEERNSELRHQGKVTNSGKQWPQRVCRQTNKNATSEEIFDRLPSMLEYEHRFTRDPTIGLCSEEAEIVESHKLQLTDVLAFNQKQTVALRKQIAEEEENNHALRQERKNLKAQMSKTTEEYRKNQEKQESKLLLEINKLNETVQRAGTRDLLQRLMPLVEQHKMRQEEELNFHSSCEKKHVELLESIQDLETKVDHSEESDNYKAEVENTLQRDCRKLKVLRGDLAKKNQNFLLYRRKLDELPSQSELMQYERCFVELYMHIQEKLQETRKYFASYNALAEANELTLKEISLLNSINVQFEEVMMSQEGRTKFVALLSNIAKGVHQKVEKMEARFLAEQNTLSELKERNSRLVAERRHYTNLMKLFQEECARNAVLRSSVFPSM